MFNLKKTKKDIVEKKDKSKEVLENAVDLLVSIHNSPPKEYSRPEYSNGYIKLLPYFGSVIEKYKNETKPGKPENYNLMKKSGFKNELFDVYERTLDYYNKSQNILNINKWCIEKLNAYGFIEINDLYEFIQKNKISGSGYRSDRFPFIVEYMKNSTTSLKFNKKVAEDITKFKKLNYKPNFKINIKKCGYDSTYQINKFFQDSYIYHINSSMKNVKDINKTDNNFEVPELFAIFQTMKTNIENIDDIISSDFLQKNYFNYLILYPVYKFNTIGFAIISYSEKSTDIQKNLLNYNEFSSYIKKVT